MLDGKDDLRNRVRGLPSFSSREAMEAYKFKTVMKNMAMSTFDYDIKNDIIYVDKEYVLLDQFTTYWFSDGGDYYYLEHVMDRLHEMVRASFLTITIQGVEDVRSNVTGKCIAIDAPIVYENGNTRWTSFLFDTLLDENGEPTYAIGYCRDVHEQKKNLYRLRNIAQTDALTGFKNRSAGIYRIQERLVERKDETFFFAVIDLDKFKVANDMFGHSFGDLILRNVADRIRMLLEHDTICCRTGGDEFLFFGKCDSAEHAMEMLTQLKRCVEHSVSYQGSQFDVGCSIGCSVYPLQGTEYEELYNKADMAMYYAKNHKSSMPVLYEESMEVILPKE